MAAPLDPAYTCLKQDSPATGALAALATVVRHHGLQVSVRTLCEMADLGTESVDPILLLFVAGRCGFDATPLEGEFEHLAEVSTPAIITLHDDRYAVLWEVDDTSAVIGETTTGLVRRTDKAEFCRQWTGDVYLVLPNQSLPEAREQLRRWADPRSRLARWAGVSPLSAPRLGFLVAVVGWMAAATVAVPVTLLVGSCMLAALWMAAYPRACRKCSATWELAGALPLPWIGCGYYALLTALSGFGAVSALWTGLLAASGAHVALVAILARKGVSCYPCIATAAMAWTALALSAPTDVGAELLTLPVAAVTAVVSVDYGVKRAARKEMAAIRRLEADAFAEPVAPNQARLITYIRASCPICAYFKTAIRPVLEEGFGDALVCDDRDAGDLPVAVPLFFVAGRVNTTLTAIPTDEMCARLSAAIEAALVPIPAAPQPR